MEEQVIRVLVVEDERADAKVIDALLTELPRVGRDLPRFETEYVHGLQPALDRLDSGAFDVVLSDLDVLNGRAEEGATTFQERVPDVPVVLLVGREQEGLARESIRAGIQDYVCKDYVCKDYVCKDYVCKDHVCRGEMTGKLLARALMCAVERKRSYEELERRVEERTAELRRANEALQEKMAECRQTKKALRESEEKARALLNTPTDAVVLLQRDGTLLDVNTTVLERFGLARDELVGSNVWSLFGPEVARRRKDEVYRVIRSGEPRRFEDLRAGLWHDHVIYPVLDTEGEVANLAWIARDITERKVTETALRERVKELSCLYAVQRELREDMPEAEVYRRVLHHLTEAFRFSGQAVGVLEIDGERLRSGEVADDLSHCLEADVAVDGNTRGRLLVCYSDERPFLLPEEHNLVEGVAGKIGAWLQRREAEQARWGSERRMRGLLDAAFHLIALVTPDGRIVECNEAYAARMGMEREALLGTCFLDLIAPDIGRARLQRVQDVAATGQPIRFVDERDGRTFDNSLYPILDAEGQVSHVAVYVVDVTEQREADEALRRSDERFERLLKASGTVVFDQDQELRYVEVRNSHAPFDRQSVLGKRDEDLLPAEDAAVLTKIKRQVLETGVGAHQEVRVTVGGEVFFYDVLVEPRYGEDGKVVGITSASTDITGRKEAEYALRRAEKFLSSTLDALSAHIAVLDERGTIIAVNDAWVRFAEEGELGWPDHGVGRNYLDVCEAAAEGGDRRAAEAAQLIRDAVARRHGTLQIEYPCPMPDEDLWFAMRVTSFESEAGVRVVVAHEDITRRKETEQELMRAAAINESVAALAQALMAAKPIEEISEMVLEYAKRLTDSSIGYVGHIDSATGNLVSTTMTKDVWDRCQVPGKDIVFEEYSGLWGWVLENREPLITNDPAKDPRSSGTPDGHLPIERFLSVPALLGDGLVGQIAVANPDQDYTKQDLRLMEQLASLYAIALQRKQTEDELTHHRDRLEELVAERTAELAEANEALQESEVRYRTVFETTGTATIIVEEDTTLSLVNAEFERLSGYARHEVEGRMSFTEFVAPEYLDTVLRNHRLRRVEPGAAARQYAGQFVDRHGETRDILLAADLIPGTKRSVGSLVDITELKETEQALERQLSRVQLLNEIARAMTSRQDLNSLYRVVLRHLEQELPVALAGIGRYDRSEDAFTIWLLGSKGQRIGSAESLSEGSSWPVHQPAFADRCAEPLYTPDLNASNHEAGSALAKAGIRSLVRVPLLIDGRMVGALFVGRPGEDAFSSGELGFLWVLGQHVSAAARQARLYGDLQDAYEDLQRTQRAMMQQERLRALGEMASGIAHDILNAISAGSLFVDQLTQEPHLSDRGRARVEALRTAFDDIEETVGRMRQFYRKRGANETFAPVNLREAVQHAVDLTKPRWQNISQEKGITINLELDLADGLPTIRGNAAEIRQAVTNLILNAVDAMPDGGELALRTFADADGESLILEVKDTGIGMDEETLRRCLEPFFTTKGERGTGMGLATVYGTMKRHEGRVEVESEPDRGTTARLIFPVGTSVERWATEETRRDVGSLRILCIDDEPLLLEALRGALNEAGHEAEVAQDGDAGLALFRRAAEQGKPFDVVVTDLGMPGKDGRQVARAVKEERPQAAVILLTGWGHRLAAQGERPANVDYVLTKPPKLEPLMGALAAVTDGR